MEGLFVEGPITVTFSYRWSASYREMWLMVFG